MFSNVSPSKNQGKQTVLSFHLNSTVIALHFASHWVVPSQLATVFLGHGFPYAQSHPMYKASSWLQHCGIGCLYLSNYGFLKNPRTSS